MPVTLTSNANTNGFLSNDFPHNPPRLYFTAEDDTFDDLTLEEWRDEGFNVAYVPMGRGGKEYRERLANLSRVGLGVGETYAVVAYGDAASFCLEHYHQHGNISKLCGLVAYYPTTIPDTQNTRFSSGVRMLVHLVGPTVGVARTQQLLGIQGKRRTIKRRISPGIGTGGMLKIAYPTYTYENVEPGFAEHDLDEYERIAAELAWSRSLNVLRRAFRRDMDIEKVWEENVHNKFFKRSTAGTLKTLTPHKSPHVIHSPTLTGGIGADQLRRFEEDLFIPSNPSSLRMRLLSRTIGADRVVDEIHMSFKHSQPMPWILPGVPATNKHVEVIVVSIVCIRGEKLYSEHVYWDQASVLLQVGLLDPKLMPEKMKGKGIDRLPIFGREAAKRILDGSDGKVMNELVPGWSGTINRGNDDRKKEPTRSEKKASEFGDELGEEEEGTDEREEEAEEEVAKEEVEETNTIETETSADTRKKEKERGKQNEEPDEENEGESTDEDEKDNKPKIEEEDAGSKADVQDKKSQKEEEDDTNKESE